MAIPSQDSNAFNENSIANSVSTSDVKMNTRERRQACKVAKGIGSLIHVEIKNIIALR